MRQILGCPELYFTLPWQILVFRMDVAAEQPQAGSSYLSGEIEKLVTDWVGESIATAMSRYAKAPVPFPTHCSAAAPHPMRLSGDHR